MSAQRWRDEIALREASLVDARRECDAGELDQATYEAIVSREEAALAHAREQLATVVVPVAKARRRRRTSRLVIALSCFAVAAVGLVWINVSLRQAGTSQTGGVAVNRDQQIAQLLTEGQADVSAGNDLAALAAYGKVLQLDPHNASALTETGWLDFSAGSASRSPAVVSHALSVLRSAVHYGPNDPATHLYYAIVATVIPHNESLARQQFRLFLRLHPSKAQRAIAAPYLRALQVKV